MNTEKNEFNFNFDESAVLTIDFLIQRVTDIESSIKLMKTNNEIVPQATIRNLELNKELLTSMLAKTPINYH